MSTTHTLPSPTSLALTTQYPPRPYHGIQECKRAVLTLFHDRLHPQANNTTDQYLTYNNITPASFHSLTRLRYRLQAPVRFTYFPTISTLTIRVLTRATEQAYMIFQYKTAAALIDMGIELAEWVPYARSAAVYTATALAPGSQKEADAAFKNRLLRPNNETDWPHMVIESGVSGSLARLRQDVNWWIGCSGGEVLIVLLLVVECVERKLIIEKYFPQYIGRRQGDSGPVTRAQAALDGFVPRLVATTVVDVNAQPSVVVEGSPLVLDFERVVGRRPVGPTEHDVVIGTASLIEMGECVSWDIEHDVC
ncbi:uncharacterized protein BO88DRAFT_489600 [Aspergillus vadensis CBS 113365]|uniref:Uncharacterized protein n=1 Tax=Aspergillus vadensis (strain CBS 113365 / IMI 142717 / IBT 24658) TaxID=1448311 RepID=A0A319B4R0_ASPVC|nr:hypothetical protein BO88DRAFT_489600 [Aspergillus vadensis CBS 113365]PYH66861.1 hypothetical protein BO88DRAFT_489600 [Aspergillus vadensis CBS 113365]